MWRTSAGNRVLSESEWAVFGAGLGVLWDDIEESISGEPDDADTGVPSFDRLTPEQKIALLADTARALRDPVAPIPGHTAANEGAIMAVFNTLWVMLETELVAAEISGEARQTTELRRLLRVAAAESTDWEGKLPSPTRASMQVWEDVLEILQGRIFWDYDFEMGDEFLDLPPTRARECLDLLRIDPDYYLAVPPEPNEAGLVAARQALARLLGP